MDSDRFNLSEDRFKMRTPAPLHLLQQCSSELLLYQMQLAAEEAINQG